MALTASAADDLYLVGGFNGWTPEDPAAKFTAGANGEYTLKYEGTLTSGFLLIHDSTYEPKYGSNGSKVEIGKPYTCQVGGNDIEIGSPVTNPTITFNVNTLELNVAGEATADEITYCIHGSIVPGEKEWNDLALEENNGKWTCTAEVSAGDFGIRKLNLGSQVAWISKDATDASVVLGTPMPCKVEGTNFTLAEAGEYTFTFDPDAMTLTVAKPGVPDPIGNGLDYYVKGNIFSGSWTDGAEKKMTYENGVYIVADVEATVSGEFGIMAINPTTNEQEDFFKAPADAAAVVLDKELKCVNEGGTNFTINKGTYTFTFNPSTNVLKVTGTVNDTPDNPTVIGYILHGSIKSGDPDKWEDMPMTEKDGVFSATVEIKPGQFGFKTIDTANGNIDLDQWLASDNTETEVEVVADKAMKVAKGGKNFVSNLEGEYTFTFDPSAMTLTVSSTGTPEPVENGLDYYVKGNIFSGSWTDGAEKKMTYENGVYIVADVEATVSGEFGIMAINPTTNEQEDFFKAPADAAAVVLDKELKCVNEGGTNFTINKGTYTFTFNPSTNVLKVTGTVNDTPDNPTVIGYILHGSIKSGNPDKWEDMPMTEKDGVFSATVEIKPGQFGFKTIDTANGNIDLDQWLASDNTETEVEVVADKAMKVAKGGKNFILNLEGEYTFTFDPTAMTLTVSSSDVPDPVEPKLVYSIYGNAFSGSDWEDKWMIEKDGIWTLENVEATTNGKFLICAVDANFTDLVERVGWYKAKAEDADVILDKDIDCVNEGVDFNLKKGTYTFTFNPATAVLKVTGTVADDPIVNPDPTYTYQIHTNIISGEWESVDMVEENGKWTLTKTIKKGQFIFKKCDNNDKVEYIKSKDGKVVTDSPMDLIGDEGTNFVSELTGEYTFTLDPVSMTLTITGEATEPIEPVVVYQLHIGEEGSEWATHDMTENNGKWTVAVELTAGHSFGIKKYDSANNSQMAWISHDGDGSINLDTPMSCKIEGSNWTPSPAGNHIFTFDPKAMTLTVSKSSGVEGIEAVEEGEAVYYNLQGVRVENPDKGIYIRVVNGKATKVVR